MKHALRDQQLKVGHDNRRPPGNYRWTYYQTKHNYNVQVELRVMTITTHSEDNVPGLGELNEGDVHVGS
jgi:hypothetical protein